MVTRDEAYTTTQAPRRERSIAGLFGDLARESTRLLRQEIALAKSEMLAKLAKIGRGAAELIAGALILYAGFLLLLAAAVLGLSQVVPPWAAALIVGGVVLLVGLGLALKGRRDMTAEKLVPGRTLRTLREDADWAREQMR
jgi:peptidoglycan/LPS O-acetylase OafA/YrhL